MAENSEFQRIEQLFQQAADLPEPERAAFLDRRCPDAPEVRARVAAMLSADDSRSFDGPPIAVGHGPMGAPLTEGPGTVIDRYKLLQAIGEGGFGVSTWPSSTSRSSARSR